VVRERKPKEWMPAGFTSSFLHWPEEVFHSLERILGRPLPEIARRRLAEGAQDYVDDSRQESEYPRAADTRAAVSSQIIVPLGEWEKNPRL
jgi:hypothetical protein